jgi:hypothetical protein
MDSVRRLVTSAASSIVISLLAAAFFVSCCLLAQHAYSAGTVNYGVAGELLLVAVLSLEGIVAVGHLRQARLDSTHHVLVAVLQEFRSAEMMLALNALWKFRREHGDQFVQDYLERWRRDDERIAQLPAEDQLRALHATLHYQRRVVKEFYNLLAGLYELKLFPKEVLYTYWNEAELSIIPKILIPLETAVAKELRTEKELGEWHQRLQHLYDDRARTSPA